jgi:carbon storage regulator
LTESAPQKYPFCAFSYRHCSDHLDIATPLTRQEQERKSTTEGSKSGDGDRVCHNPDAYYMDWVRKLIARTAERIERQENVTRINFRRSDMLVLSRKLGEKVVLGNGITLTVVEVRGKRVRLAFGAPDEVHILRAEIACRHAEPAGGDGLADLRPRVAREMSTDHMDEIVRLIAAIVDVLLEAAQSDLRRSPSFAWPPSFQDGDKP